MVDFIKFVKEHPGIDLTIDHWHTPEAIVITMTKYPSIRYQQIRRFRFCISDKLLHNLVDIDAYIEMWLSKGLEELNKEDKNDQD